jgi:hypothetical protein
MTPGDTDAAAGEDVDGEAGEPVAPGAVVEGITPGIDDVAFVVEDGGARPGGVVGSGAWVGAGEMVVSAQNSKSVIAPPLVINKHRRVVFFIPMGIFCTEPLPSPPKATRTGALSSTTSISMKSLLLLSMSIRPIENTSKGVANSKHKTPPNRLSSGNGVSDSWMIRIFPRATQFSPFEPGWPPSPVPGPAELHSLCGLPRSGSPVDSDIPGSEVLKILAAPPGVNPP